MATSNLDETVMMRYFLVVAVVLLAFVGVATVVWGDVNDRYVPETGHVIDSNFVPFYDKHGGSFIFGLPITDAFIDPLSQILIQYFENARLELIPDEGSGWQVQLAPLGQMLYGWDQPTEEEFSQPAKGCRYFPDARFSVCHAFLDFYEEHGDIDVFGLPISSNRVEDGNLVQLFQRFRLEWVDTDAKTYVIRISPLGRIHFDFVGYDQELLQHSIVRDANTTTKEALYIETSLSTPLLEAGATQVVFVTVRDHNLSPIEGASTLLTAHLATGLQYILLPTTDENGVTFTSLTVDEPSTNNDVLLEFLVQYGDTITTARDSFLIR